MVALDQYKISPEIIKISKHHIKPNQIDNDAKSIIKKLNKGGFKGFIVGGFVRDSILGLQPKDCDVVTDATPEEIKNLLPRTRIIGRRFKIVHARSGRNITEISTFRSSSKKYIQKSKTKIKQQQNSPGLSRSRWENRIVNPDGYIRRQSERE